MSRVAAIVTMLDTGVPALVALSPPPVPPDAVFPYVTVQEVLETELENLIGRSGNTRTVMQVNVFSKSYEEAESVREACKVYLMGRTGVFQGQTIDAINYQHGGYLYDGQQSLHQCIARFLVWWRT